jgi:hypothetical protein
MSVLHFQFRTSEKSRTIFTPSAFEENYVLRLQLLKEQNNIISHYRIIGRFHPKFLLPLSKINSPPNQYAPQDMRRLYCFRALAQDDATPLLYLK